MKATKIINMDYNSTTPLAAEVVDAIKDACVNLWANPSSGHQSGRDVKRAICKSRKQIGAMLNCQADEIVFTSGGTEANNWVVYSSVEEFAKTKNRVENDCRPHVVTTNLEHDSIRLILEKFVSEDKIEVTFVPVSKVTGAVEPEDIIGAIRPMTVLITVMLANNETGIMQPVNRIAELLCVVNGDREWPKILLHTDAAQAIGKIAVDVNDLGVDYLTVVGHKFYGPRIGALYRRMAGHLHPIFFGGGQENGMRPGTENTPMIVGLGVAAQLVTENVSRFENQMETVRDELEMQLAKAFGQLVTLNGRQSSKYGRLPNTVSLTFNDEKLQGFAILELCQSLRASVGAACHSGQGSKPSAVLISSGVVPALASCTIRLSVGRETTISDVANGVNELKEVVTSIRGELEK